MIWSVIKRFDALALFIIALPLTLALVVVMVAWESACGFMDWMER